jgi:hypothetical protein
VAVLEYQHPHTQDFSRKRRLPWELSIFVWIGCLLPVAWLSAETRLFKLLVFSAIPPVLFLLTNAMIYAGSTRIWMAYARPAAFMAGLLSTILVMGGFYVIAAGIGLSPAPEPYEALLLLAAIAFCVLPSCVAFFLTFPGPQIVCEKCRKLCQQDGGDFCCWTCEADSGSE